MKMYYKSTQSPITPKGETPNRSPLGLGASWLAYSLSLFLTFSLIGNVRLQAQIVAQDGTCISASDTWSLGGTVGTRNIYDASSVIPRAVGWNNNRWEILADADMNGSYETLLHYNTFASTPNPPTLGTGTWIDAGAGCGVLTQFNGAFTQNFLGGSLQYRTAGTVTFASPTNWESSPDGTTWSAAASAPDATANTLPITIQNGHTATVDANITLDQLTVASGGALVVSTGVILTVADGAGTDLLVNGTIDIQGTGFLQGVGGVAGTEVFALAAGAKLITSNAGGVTGGAVSAVNIGQSWVDGSDYTFNATNIFQTASLPAGVTIRNLEINNTHTTPSVLFDAPPYTITGTLTLTAGSADFTSAGDFIFSSPTPIVRTGGTIITSGDTNLSFTGAAFTLPTGTFSNTPFDIGNLTIGTNDLNLSNQGMQVIGTLTISSTGKLNLNGNNINLVGLLAENLATNGVVYDATATSYTNKGGYIQVVPPAIPAFANGAYTSIAGIGLEIEGATTDITEVRRYHYPPTTGGGNSFSKGIKRVYDITGIAASGVTDIKINYASSELNGISDAIASDMYISRWSSGTGWTSFKHGTNGVTFSTNSIEMVNITTGFSTWTMSGASASLPITLLGLKGYRVSGGQGNGFTEEVRLEWSTANEINNKGFEVEMSENGIDYKKIAFIEGRGQSTTIQPYNHTTIQPQDAYYRLKQVDFDGKFSYSPVVFVEGVVGKVVVYPNPSNGAFTVIGGTQTTALDSPARLLNAQGTVVATSVATGQNSEGTKFATTGLPAGVYFLHTVVAGKTKITKVVIM